jgi:transcriptional regulator with XRE-family HTH domain
MTLGEKLEQLRHKNGYTQEQVAELLGISRQAVGKWEAGLAYPETEKLIEIGRLFDCSMDYLLKEEICEQSGGESGFYGDVKAIGRKLATPENRRKMKKGAKIAAIIAGAVLALDFISMLVYFLIWGIPQ